MIIETYTIAVDINSNAADALGDIDNKVTSLGKKIDRNFKDIGRSIQSSLQKIRLPALVVAGGGVAIFNKLKNGASALEESVNAVNVVFGQSSEQILKFSKDAAKSVGLSQKEFNKLSVNTGALLKDTGLNAEQLSKTTIDLTKRAADMASVFDTDVSDALSAINQALRGETEAIRRYAGDVTDATLQTFLNSKGIKKQVKNLTQQEKRLQRVNLIMEQTSVTQGDFINTIDSVANAQRVQAAQTENVADSFGKRLLPVMKAIQRVTGVVIDIFAGLSPATQDWIVKIGLAVTAISGFLFAVSFIAPALTALAPAIFAVGRALRFLALNPVGLLITAVALVVWDLWKAFNGGDSVLKNIFDWFSVRFPNAAEKLKEVFKSVADSIKNFFKGTADLIRDTAKLARGEISGKQFLFGEGGLEALRKQQFSTPSFGSPQAAKTSTETSTTTTNIDTVNVQANNLDEINTELTATAGSFAVQSGGG